jgi:uncharacterized membrane protein YcfT
MGRQAEGRRRAGVFPPRRDARVDWVDYAKGWCIVFVVMMHSTLGVGDALGGEGILHTIVAFARPFRMPDFFLIAGLFLSRVVDRDWRDFLDRKFAHFLYFYVLWMLIQIFVKQGLLLVDRPDAFLYELGMAFLEPYAMLWFIYLLPVMFVLTKLLRRVPVEVVLGLAALSECLYRLFGWHTGWIMIDELAVRYVYFYAGYAFAPLVFRLADWAREHAWAALGALILGFLGIALAVFTPANVLPAFVVPAAMLGEGDALFRSVAFVPGLSLLFGFTGVACVVILSVLLARGDLLLSLRYAGEHSLVIYLCFFLPMAAARVLLIFLGFRNISLVSAIVTVTAVLAPLIFYRIIRKTGFKFLFERPQFFHIPNRQAAEKQLRFE